MAKFISTIHDRVNFATKKGLTGYFSPDKIDNEVHAESLNLWREYIKSFEKTRIMDAYLRVFQQQEIVELYNGLANYMTQDYIYMMEGFNNPTITKLIDSSSYNTNTDVDLTIYDRGFQHWVVLSTTTYATPVTITLKLDGVQIYTAVVTNQQIIVPYIFTSQKTLSVGVSGGTLTFSLWKVALTSNNTEILWVDNQKYLYRINHPVKAPTDEYPVASNFDQQLTVLPSTTFNYVAMSILKRPTKPVYAFTVSGDRYIYNDSQSVDFEWDETVLDVIMERTLANLGINMKDAQMIQYSNSQRQLEQIAK